MDANRLKEDLRFMKKRFEDADAIIFDLDGTLWDASQGICNTWNEVLAKKGLKRGPFSKEELSAQFGKTMYDIADAIVPELEKADRDALMEEMCEYEVHQLYNRGGILYPDLKETLEYLSSKLPLCIVSNCQCGYIEDFLHAHDCGKYFKDFSCWGQTMATKGETNKIVIERNGFKNPVYVGDTAGDRQSAIDAGIPFIFASYGFGSVEDYDGIIHTFKELKDLF